MIIIGEKEEKEGTVSVRKQGKGNIGTFSIEDFVSLLKKEIEKTKITFNNLVTPLCKQDKIYKS